MDNETDISDLEVNQKLLDDITNRSLDDIPVYDEDIDYIESEYVEEDYTVDFTNIETSKDQTKINEIMLELADIDIDDSKRDKYLDELNQSLPNLVIEYVQNLCSSYEENQSSILKQYIQQLIKSSTIIHFIVKLQAADSIKDINLLYFLLNQLIYQECKDVEMIVATAKIRSIYKHNENFLPECLNDVFRYILKHHLIKDVEKIEMCKECESSLPFLREVELEDPGKWGVFILQLLQNKYNDLEPEDIDRLESLVISNDISVGVLYDFLLGLTDCEKWQSYINKAKQWFEEHKEDAYYANEQNVHHVSSDTESYLDILMSVDLQHKTVQEWFDILKDKFQTELCNMALQRMSVDLSVYGKASLNLKQIFVRSMLYIQSRSVEEQEFLSQRMKEELEDTALTCSSGHLIRLMNVFSGLDNFVKIDPHVELRACIFHRLQKAIESMPEEQQDLVLDALMQENEESKDSLLQQSMYKTFAEIHDSLQKEYVGQSLLNEQQFTEQYRESIIAFSSRQK